MATLFVDKLDPQSGTALEIGTSGDTVTVPSGATFNVAGTLQSGGAAVVNTPTFLATISGGNQSVSASTYTTITINSEQFDTGGCFNNTGSTVTLNGISTPAYSFAPNVSGKYFLFGKTQSQSGGTYEIMYLKKNGDNVVEVQYYSDVGSARSCYGGTIVEANGSSDTFSMVRWQNGGTLLTYQGINNTFFGAYKIIE